MDFEFNLPVENVDLKDAESLIQKTDILIVTVNEKERESLLKFVLPIPEKKSLISIVHKNSTYRIGRLGYYLIAHVQSGMGSSGRGASALTVYKAIEFLKPKVVIMVGVAFGINPKKQHLGDVLISKRIINYEVARICAGDNDITPRGDEPNSGALLYNIFTNIIDWNHYVSQNRRAKIIFGDLLSGEKLIDNLGYRNFLKNKFPNAIGGEMEGTGVSSACGEASLSEWIVIKGICDWADGKKKKGFQPKAALSSMSLVFHTLSSPAIFNGLSIQNYSKEIVEGEKEKYCLNAQKGTPLWTLNRIRSSVLTMLIKDLKSFQEEGYSNDICLAVKRDLDGLLDEIQRLPIFYDGSSKLRQLFQDFIKTYAKWNDVNGSGEGSELLRFKYRNELKKIRNEISIIIRLSQKSLSYNIEEINSVKMFEFQEELIQKYADVFPNLRKAVRKMRGSLKNKIA